MNVRMEKIKEEWLPLIMDWRMRPYITKFMNTDPVLTLDSQRDWFIKIEKDSSQKHWVILMDEVPIGLVQLMDIDFQNERCEWGWYIAEKEKRSFQLAVQIMYNLYDYVFDVLHLNKVYGQTFLENDGMVKLHMFCGNTQEGILRRHIKKNGQFYDVVVTSILKDEWVTQRRELIYEKFSFA